MKEFNCNDFPGLSEFHTPEKTQPSKWFQTEKENIETAFKTKDDAKIRSALRDFGSCVSQHTTMGTKYSKWVLMMAFVMSDQPELNEQRIKDFIDEVEKNLTSNEKYRKDMGLDK